MKEPPRDLVALGVAVLCLVRPEVTAEQLHKSFGSSSLPAAAEPCARFWRDWAHNALVEFGDSLMSALHVSAASRPHWLRSVPFHAQGERHQVLLT
jgi:hypothetical protein